MNSLLKRRVHILPAFFALGLLALPACCSAAAGRGQASPVVVGVASPAMIWSPFTWTGDAGRGGSVFRQTTAPGAYFRLNWVTTSSSPTCSIQFDTSLYGTRTTNLPLISASIDGRWLLRVPVAKSISVAVSGSGRHQLTFVVSSVFRGYDRWGSAATPPTNVVRVTGVQLNSGSVPSTTPGGGEYALMVGDSITEGILAGPGATDDAVYDYAHLIGEALRARGYEYGVSAYNGTGMTITGFGVPPYYEVTGSTNGQGGVYNDAQSRWNKLDGHGHSLLDSSGMLSAYGGTGQAPSVILMNYGTNDALYGGVISDVESSVSRCLAALRASAPQAWIFVIVPFVAHDAQALGTSPGGPAIFAALLRAVTNYMSAHPSDTKVVVLDLGQQVSDTAASCTLWGTSALHINTEGHAAVATLLIHQLWQYL